MDSFLVAASGSGVSLVSLELKTPISVLHAEDSHDDAALIIRELQKAFNVTHRIVSSRAELKDALRSKWDVVLSDFSMPGFTGLEALTIVKEAGLELPFVFVSGTIGEESAVEAIKAGAHDYVIKDSLRRLNPVVQRVLREAEAKERLKASERNLAKISARYRLFAENSSDIIAVRDDRLLIQYISPSLQPVTGYLPEELLETDGLQIVVKSQAGYLSDLLRKAMDYGEPFQGTFSVRHKTGSIIWLEIRGRTVLNPVTNRREILTVARDVTERHAAEVRNRELAMLLDVAHDAIQVRDLEHRILFWNKGAEKIYGWSFDEVRAKPARDLMYMDPDEFEQAQIILLQNGQFEGELHQKRRGGEPLVTRVSWTLVKDEKNIPKSVLCIHTDITEEKKMEANFLRAQRLDSIGTLASGIAHDLNNALTPVLMAAAMLQTELQSEYQKELLETILLSARRGADMVKHILAFARGGEKSEAVVDLRGILRDIEKIVRDTFPKDIDFAIMVKEPLWLIKADVTQIHQVLMNLVVNSRDAMEQGGLLRVSAENRVLDGQYAMISGGIATGKYLLIHIEDSGTGIPPHLLDKVFDPFFTTKERGKGTGLGLSTAMAIIRGHGGFMRAYSEPGKGTQFHIYLPALLDEVDPVAEGPRNTRAAGGSGECILVVDDEKVIRNITARTLVENGYTVLEAADGAEAAAIFADRKADISLVLTDVMMPVLDGPGLIHVIRKINPILPIITASGLEGNARLKLLEGDGRIRFIAKPYTAEVLLNAVALSLNK